MTKKRSGAAKKVEVEEAEVDLEAVFGLEDPGPEEEEETDGVQDEARGQEAQGQEEEEVPPEEVAPEETPPEETYSEETPPEETPPQEEPAEPQTEEQIREKVIAEREEHEKGLRNEMKRLRNELQAELAKKQAPMPLQQQPPQPPAGAPTPPPSSFKFEFEVGDDGNLRPTDSSMQEFQQYNESLVNQRVEAATRVDPEVEFNRIVETESQKWIAGDPAKFNAAQRMRQATDDMALMGEHYMTTTGHQPQGIDEWVQTIESTEIGQRFKAMYPEVTDLGGFLDTFLMPGEIQHRIWKTRRYMDNYVATSSPTGAAPSSGAPAPQPSNVVPLPTNRPRSMAQKGRGTEQGMTEKQEYELLESEVGDDPIGMSPDAKEKYERMQYLARKLNVDM